MATNISQTFIKEKQFIIHNNDEYLQVVDYLSVEFNLIKSEELKLTNTKSNIKRLIELKSKYKSYTIEEIQKKPQSIYKKINNTASNLCSYNGKLYITIQQYITNGRYMYISSPFKYLYPSDNIDANADMDIDYTADYNSSMVKKMCIMSYEIHSKKFKLEFISGDEIINEIQQSTGNIIIKNNFKDTITVYDENSEQLYKIHDEKPSRFYRENNYFLGASYDPNIQKILSTKNGKMYFSSALGGIYNYNEKGIYEGNIRYSMYLDSRGRISPIVYDLMTTYENNLIFRLTDGLPSKNNTFEIYIPNCNQFNIIPNVNKLFNFTDKTLLSAHYNNNLLYLYTSHIDKNENTSEIKILDMRKNNILLDTIRVEQNNSSFNLMHVMQNIYDVIDGKVKIFIAESKYNELYYINV